MEMLSKPCRDRLLHPTIHSIIEKERKYRQPNVANPKYLKKVVPIIKY